MIVHDHKGPNRLSAVTPLAKANQRNRNTQYKQHRRATDPSFAEREKAARRRHGKKRYAFSKFARDFVKTYPTEFAQFLRSEGVDNQVIRSAIGLPVTRPSDPRMCTTFAPVIIERPTPQPIPPQRDFFPLTDRQTLDPSPPPKIDLSTFWTFTDQPRRPINDRY
jgi:hypothetical protein